MVTGFKCSVNAAGSQPNSILSSILFICALPCFEVSWSPGLFKAHLFVVGLTQKLVDHKTVSNSCHVGLHVGLFIHFKLPWFLRLSSSKVKWDGLALSINGILLVPMVTDPQALV